MRIDRGTTIKESLLTEVWRQQAMGKATLLTRSGKRIHVIHPGRKSNDSGPDFSDALITIDGERVKGSVEIHVNSRQWQAHGHHKDPGFNDTILHVVMWDDGEETTLLHSKERIPVLALSPYLHGSTEELGQLVRSALVPEEPCRKAFKRGGRASVLDALNKAGEERFYSRVGKFKAAMKLNQAEQVLYEGMMAALGYAKNKEPFEELARTMSLRLLSNFASRGAIIEIQASMLGAAGLLPMDFPMGTRKTQACADDSMELDRLQQTWTSLEFKETVGRSKWRFFRVRPENSPTRRIIAFSHILAGCRGKLMRSMLSRLSQSTASKAQKDLELGLMVKTDGYWASHFHFGIEAGWCPTLIGRSRARDIIVNVLLPFSFAWSQANSDSWLRNRSRELYLSHPKLQENWITRYMGMQILGDEREAVVSRSACHQQGLIHLYRTYCAEHRCHVCPLA